MQKVLLAALAVAVSVVLPLSAFAQSGLPTGIQSNIDRATSLGQQIKALQEEQAKILSEITQALRQGSQGDQVKIIQALLAADATIYPEGLITGYYGPLTSKAVKRFQEKNGLEGVGLVGPKTRKLFNELLKGTPIVFGTASSTGTTTLVFWKHKNDDDDEDDDDDDRKGNGGDNRPCVIVPPGHLIAPGWLRKHKGDDKPVLPPCQILPPGIAKKLGYPVGTTTPPGQGDKTAPALSSIAASANASTAVITWTTNEVSDSAVLYGTTTAYTGTASNGSLVTNHSLTLTGLLPVTLYNYQVKSRDAAGNTATSTNLTFTTSALSDTTAPSISNVASSIGSTTATVTWTTNEAATSRIYYSTSTPVNLGTASVVSNTSLVTSHSLSLVGLTASTTHYFLLNSIDGAGNSATSSEQSFLTQ